MGPAGLQMRGGRDAATRAGLDFALCRGEDSPQKAAMRLGRGGDRG